MRWQLYVLGSVSGRWIYYDTCQTGFANDVHHREQALAVFFEMHPFVMSRRRWAMVAVV